MSEAKIAGMTIRERANARAEWLETVEENWAGAAGLVLHIADALDIIAGDIIQKREDAAYRTKVVQGHNAALSGDGFAQIERTPFEATPEAAKRLSLSDPIEGVETARLVVICGCGVILETPAEYREHSCGCETCGNARTRLHRDETGLFCEKCS